VADNETIFSFCRKEALTELRVSELYKQWSGPALDAYTDFAM
jgi:hypothetical protein